MLSQSHSAEQSRRWLYTQAEPTADVTHSYSGCQFILTWVALSSKIVFCTPTAKVSEGTR